MPKVPIRELLEEFDKEMDSQSDRAISLIVVSILEELLKELIENHLIDNPKIIKDLFGVKGSIGTFDDKVKLSYGLGLVTDIEYELLIKLQRIRNKLAHNVLNASFDDDSIKNICLTIKLPKDAHLPKMFRITPTTEKVNLNPITKETSARHRYRYAFEYLVGSIYYRISKTRNNRPQTPEKNFYYIELIEEYLGLVDESYKAIELGLIEEEVLFPQENKEFLNKVSRIREVLRESME